MGREKGRVSLVVCSLIGVVSFSPLDYTGGLLLGTFVCGKCRQLGFIDCSSGNGRNRCVSVEKTDDVFYGCTEVGKY